MDTTLTIKTNGALRKEAKKMAEELGLTLTAVVNAYLKQFVRERKFTASAEPMPSKRSIALWEEISREMDEGKGSSGPFSNAEDLIAHLKL
jgi:antitoxin component of RelBE/YafQ-DinJ toxin-antitoxin module